MNISGHRISTAEVESALVGHSGVAEAAVVGATDPTTGQASSPSSSSPPTPPTPANTDHRTQNPSLQTDQPHRPTPRIHIVPELPKTRSGKIMRRLLRDIAEGRELGDTSTLVDPTVFEAIRASK